MPRAGIAGCTWSLAKSTRERETRHPSPARSNLLMSQHCGCRLNTSRVCQAVAASGLIWTRGCLNYVSSIVRRSDSDRSMQFYRAAAFGGQGEMKNGASRLCRENCGTTLEDAAQPHAVRRRIAAATTIDPCCGGTRHWRCLICFAWQNIFSSEKLKVHHR